MHAFDQVAIIMMALSGET